MSVPKIPYLSIHTPSGDRTLLYRFYDQGGALLYVGITKDPHRRWDQHHRKNRTGWWAQVCVVHTEWYPTRAQAEAAEVVAIQTEYPVHNISNVLTPRPHRRLPSKHLHSMARDHFGDQPFTYWDLSEQLNVPYGTIATYAFPLVQDGSFLKTGERKIGRSRRSLFVAVEREPEPSQA